ncbi:MAG: 2-oxo acid dehydrogenase subunit E2, partial [Aigarchaeota archaeon]|nr:2-oxo acid dehydrogenase subunit E2 [Aigarchaeota archaeon]
KGVESIVMPRLDIDMESGTVVRWMKEEGEPVRADEPVVEVMSEKVSFEVTSPVKGEVYRIVVPPNQEVPIGQVLAVVRETGDSVRELDLEVQEAVKSLEARTAEKASAAIPIERQEQEAQAPRGGRVRASPLARRLAEQHHLDLATVQGTGPGGRITRDDVLAAVKRARAPAAAAQPAPVESIPLIGIRKLTAEKMSSSFTHAPHAFVSVEVDATNLLLNKKKTESSLGVSVPYDAFFVSAVAKALKQHRILNSTLVGEEIKLLPDINVGVAMATEKGLIVPVVHQADMKSISDLAQAVNDLAERARAEKLALKDVKGGSFTITNLGMFGVDSFTPIINLGQAGIVSFGRVKEEPRVEDGKVVVKPVLRMGLSFDHRIVDGAPAAKFLSTVKELLEKTGLHSDG